MAEVKGPAATGQVEAIQEKQSNSGDTYTLIKLKGTDKKFYDWNNMIGDIKTGDTVKIKHHGGPYPKINTLEKIADGKQKDNGQNPKYYDRERQIARATALKCSIELLKANEYSEPNYITSLAEQFEKWLLR